MLFASSAHSALSGLSLMAAALYLYFYDYRQTKNPLHLRGLFSLFWTGGQGISCLKLSRLQGEWNYETWACFFVAQTSLWCVFEFLRRRELLSRKESAGDVETCASESEETYPAGTAVLSGNGYGKGLFEALLIVTAVSLSAFLFEAAVLGYVPFFVRGVPHAYSYFHISGVHYFTVSCVLAPSLGVLYFLSGDKGKLPKRIAAAVFVAVSLAIPLLCVSRFQLIFAVFLAVITYMMASGKRKLFYMAGAVAALIPFYVLLTIARSHDVAYLNGIFEMKNGNTPIFVTQPYMYIANNYDNFNCLVEQLPAHTFGLRMLFPVWALTGLKFLKPELAAFPIYTTKEELTTVTLFYDAYYDFGIAGVFFFSAALGAAAFWLMRKTGQGKNPVWFLFYAQAAVYFMLSFFTTWYSNPATWFYLAATGAVFAYTALRRRRRGHIES